MQAMKYLTPLLILAATPSTSYAYFDPGSGVVMLQVLIAACLGVLFRFRGWINFLLRKIKDLIRR